jgi:hypothetical protein
MIFDLFSNFILSIQNVLESDIRMSINWKIIKKILMKDTIWMINSDFFVLK